MTSQAGQEIQPDSFEANESSEVSEIVEVDEEILSPGGVMQLDSSDIF
jgi:hypothetical protein